MILALLAETALSMARYCAAKKFRNVDVRSGRKATSYVASTKTVALELSHLTLTSFRHESKLYDSVLSNWTPLTAAIFSDIHEHEASEWGHRRSRLPVDHHYRPLYGTYEKWVHVMKQRMLA